MKKIVMDNELRKYMNDAINIICNTVKNTIGPKGCNVIIDHSLFSPFITNDGVTIAENIESDDEIINTILELIKSASIKTNEVVGDGTTTTLVLLQSIYNEGIKYIDNGINPIILKKEIMNALHNIISSIKNLSKNIENKNLYDIAFNSCADEEISDFLIKSYENVKDFNSISIIESSNNISTLKYYKGYRFSFNIPNDYYFKNKNMRHYTNVYTLLINDYVDDINILSDILNYVVHKKGTLLIIAEDFEDYFVNQIVSYNNDYDINILLIKINEYGSNMITIFKDLEVISNSNIIYNKFKINLDNIGFIESLNVDNENIILSFKINENIEEYKKNIILENNINFDKDFYNNRLSMFNNGLCEIHVGGFTQIEIREKKMKYDDALCALKSCKNGILPGCGISLLNVSDNINSDNIGLLVFKKSLCSPFNQIMINSGLDFNEIYNNIIKSNYKKIYNINNDKYEDINTTSVIDPTDVVINSLVNATSVACMLLTTTSLIINEHKINSTFNENM